MPPATCLERQIRHYDSEHFIGGKGKPIFDGMPLLPFVDLIRLGSMEIEFDLLQAEPTDSMGEYIGI